MNSHYQITTLQFKKSQKIKGIMLKNYSKKNGFTLIELIITLVILGIIASTAMPSFLKIIRKQEIASTADRIANLIRFSHNESIRLGKNVMIYPALIKQNGNLNGPATSWDHANSILAFSDKESSDLDQVNKKGIYDQQEEIKSTWLPKNIKISPLVRKIDAAEINLPYYEEAGFILTPNYSLRIKSNFRKISSGQKNLVGLIRLENKYDDNICQIVIISPNGRAKACKSKDISDTVNSINKKLCTC